MSENAMYGLVGVVVGWLISTITWLIDDWRRGRR